MKEQFSTRFLIVGTYRSGTSAIVEALGRHPRILCGYEWTLRLPSWRTIRVAEDSLNGDFTGLLQKHRTQVEAGLTDLTSVIGFKRLFRSSDKWLVHPRFAPAIAVDRLEGHLKWLAKNPQVHVVHIVRTDNLAWLKSKVLSDASGRFSGGQYPDDLRLAISAAQAKRRVATKLWIDGRLASLSVTNPYLRVNHEAFVADNLGVAEKMVRFLGCDPSELPSSGLRHQSQSKRSLATISNMDAIREALGHLAHLPQGN
jgi:hypothetical protein